MLAYQTLLKTRPSSLPSPLLSLCDARRPVDTRLSNTRLRETKDEPGAAVTSTKKYIILSFIRGEYFKKGDVGGGECTK